MVKEIYAKYKGICLKIKIKPKMNGDNLVNIEGYYDSNNAGDKKSRRSIPGVVFYSCDTQICWISKRKKRVTLLTTKSETLFR